jgi:23S rRNA (guanosine2251-2'-O)-methyltransferase
MQPQKIFGIRVVIEAINAGKTISKVYLRKNARGPLLQELTNLISKNNISSSHVPIEKLNHLSKHQNHQGVVAEVSMIEFATLDTLITKSIEENSSPLFLVIDQITDVRNFGAIIRTAECTGVNGIVIQKQGNAPINSETIKTSAGAAFNVPICKVDHIRDALFEFQAADIQIIAASEKTTNSIYDLDFKKPIAIIIGSEEKGIGTSLLKMANHTAKLPIMGEIKSLNVSVACGAILYEATRQRGI